MIAASLLLTGLIFIYGASLSNKMTMHCLGTMEHGEHDVLVENGQKNSLILPVNTSVLCFALSK